MGVKDLNGSANGGVVAERRRCKRRAQERGHVRRAHLLLTFAQFTCVTDKQKHKHGRSYAEAREARGHVRREGTCGRPQLLLTY